MKKRIINLIILLSDTLFIFIIVTGKVNVECLFKKIFHISCPGCGLTRSFRSILNLDFINAFKYNILGIPLFILCIIYIIILYFLKNTYLFLFYFYSLFSSNIVRHAVVLINMTKTSLPEK